MSIPFDPAHAAVFDHVIVGGGTAGCLLANRLSATGRARVLLIEAGARDTYPWIHIPVGYLYCIGNPRTDWMYQTRAEPALGGRSLPYPRGKVLGGCSSINGMIYMRGQRRDYDGWAEITQNKAWAWEQALTDFMRHEDHYGPKPGREEAHGRGGELRVEAQRLRWDVLDDFATAMTQAGVPRTDDFNAGSNEGVGYFEVNQKKGWRWSAARAFLRPARDRPNLTVWTNAEARRLTFEQSADRAPRCTGVEVIRDGQRVQVLARAEVVLSAGAVNSPWLLQRSGLGPAQHLRAHGVEVVRDCPRIGAGLQDHLQIRAIYRLTNGRTLNQLANSWWGRSKIGAEYMLRRRGPMSMAPSQLGAFTRSHPDLAEPNLEYHVQPLSLDAFGETKLHDFPGMTVSICNLNPTSRGHVRLGDNGPDIAPNYLSTDADLEIAVASLRQVREMMSQPAMARYAPVEERPGVEHQSDAALRELAGQIATTIFHPAGTVAMGGPDDADAPLDSQLQLRGVRGLRVVDASIMPRITSGNTNAPTMMIAEKAARWIYDDFTSGRTERMS